MTSELQQLKDKMAADQERLNELESMSTKDMTTREFLLHETEIRDIFWRRRLCLDKIRDLETGSNLAADTRRRAF